MAANDMAALHEGVIALAHEAAAKILEVYESEFAVQHKDDRSPLTAADLASHRCILAGLERLAPLVRALDIPCIYAPPGPDHETVAAAASALLGLPVMPWPAIGVPAPGLVVAFNLDHIEPPALSRLAERRADQIFYAHAAGWTKDAAVAPDVTTLVAESAALAPEPGAANCTSTPETGLPNASLTETTSGSANGVPTVAAWSLPETIATAAGAAGTFVSANDAGARPDAIAVTA